jgi:[ribosomal protein S5]-alanine N-acetyltransferase
MTQANLKAPERIETARLVLRKPVAGDAPAIFQRYASDREVTRYMAFPTHKSLADTESFLALSDAQWGRTGVGPYLAFARQDSVLLGSTGLEIENPHCATTGYIFVREVWGKGYATEALGAMVDLAASLNIRRLQSSCHVEHRASARVMEKCGFEYEGRLRKYMLFPNLRGGELADVFIYSRIF